MAATVRPVDLTNAKEGGVFRPRRKPEADYLAKIVKADDHQPNDKTKPLGWVLTIMINGDARSTYPYYLSPEEKQAWKVRGICVAAGLNVKTTRIRFDPNKLVGKTIGVALADDEYEGKLKSVIEDVMPPSEVGPNADEDAPEYDDADEVPDDDEVALGDDEDEEEAPAPPPARKRRAKPVPEPEPEDDEEEEEEEEEAPTPPPVRKRRPKPAPEPEPEEDEEEAEPEPAPTPRRRRAVTPPAKKAAPARKRAAAPVAEDDDDDDLDDLDTDDLD